MILAKNRIYLPYKYSIVITFLLIVYVQRIHNIPISQLEKNLTLPHAQQVWVRSLTTTPKIHINKEAWREKEVRRGIDIDVRQATQDPDSQEDFIHNIEEELNEDFSSSNPEEDESEDINSSNQMSSSENYQSDSSQVENIGHHKSSPERIKSKEKELSLTTTPCSSCKIVAEENKLLRKEIETFILSNATSENGTCEGCKELAMENLVLKEKAGVGSPFSTGNIRPAYPCDDWDGLTRTCYLDRNIGDTATFVLAFHKRANPEIQWAQEFHLYQSKKKRQYVIDAENPLWNIVIGSRGHEMRVSPITEMDIDYNSFSATIVSYLAKLHKKRVGKTHPLDVVNFKIRVIPSDLGFVYPGETLMLNMKRINLPSANMKFKWYLEKDGEYSSLPSNMRLSPSGGVLTISELRKEQEGVLSCAVFTNMGFFATKQRYLIKELNQTNNMLLYEPIQRRKRSVDADNSNEPLKEVIENSEVTEGIEGFQVTDILLSPEKRQVNGEQIQQPYSPPYPNQQPYPPPQSLNAQQYSPIQNTNQQQYAPPQNPNEPQYSPAQNPNEPQYSPAQNPDQQQYSPAQNPNQQQYSPVQNTNEQQYSAPQNPIQQQYAPTQTANEQQYAPPPHPGQQQYAPPPNPDQQQYAPPPDPGQQQYAPPQIQNEQQYPPGQNANEQQYSPQNQNQQPYAPLQNVQQPQSVVQNQYANNQYQPQGAQQAENILYQENANQANSQQAPPPGEPSHPVHYPNQNRDNQYPQQVPPPGEHPGLVQYPNQSPNDQYPQQAPPPGEQPGPVQYPNQNQNNQYPQQAPPPGDYPRPIQYPNQDNQYPQQASPPGDHPGPVQYPNQNQDNQYRQETKILNKNIHQKDYRPNQKGKGSGGRERQQASMFKKLYNSKGRIRPKLKQNKEEIILELERKPVITALQKAQDRLSKMIANCTTVQHCSADAACIQKNPKKAGFCRCRTGFQGNGIFCWEEIKVRNLFSKNQRTENDQRSYLLDETTEMTTEMKMLYKRNALIDQQ